MKSRLFRILSFGGLAVFMGVAGVWGSVAALPMVFSAEAQTQTGGLGLDPENDPVVFTTNGGLEIRKHEAVVSGNGQIISTATYTTNRNYSYTQNLINFYYFTMGTFSGTYYNGNNTSLTANNVAVNWIIIGKGCEFSGIELTEENSPAAIAIKNDVNSELREFFGEAPESVTVNEEIPDDCVLVMSEKMLGAYRFNGSGSIQGTSYSYQTVESTYYTNGNRYRYMGSARSVSPYTFSYTIDGNVGGDLYNYINNLFSKDIVTGKIVEKNALGFSEEQAALIRPQQLYTPWKNSDGTHYETPLTDSETYYSMFPLAYRNGETKANVNFCIEDYLTTDAQRVACFINTFQAHPYWLRECSIVFGSGALGEEGGAWVYYGVRPAFVMEFVPDLVK